MGKGCLHGGDGDERHPYSSRLRGLRQASYSQRRRHHLRCDTHGTDSKFKLVSRPTLQFTISGERNDTPSKKDIDITAQVAKNNELNLLGMDPKDIPKDADVDEILNDLIGKEFFATVGASNTRIIITNLLGA